MADSFSLKAILSADGSQMSSTFNQISGQVGGLQKTLMGGIGFGMLSSIGGKAVDLVSKGVKAMTSTVMDSGMSFEAAGSQIAATMGKSKSEITDIINEAARLGATTSFTATQAAQGFNVLAMSGLDAQQQIAAMAPVLDLAAAGSYSLENAASQVVGTVKGFGDSFDNAQKYADMFAKGATLASTDVNMLGTAMSDSAALAASYGQKADRTCIALLRLAEQNVTGSEAATAMSRAMADLYTPTDAAAKKLEELGVKVYEDSGEARDFNNVVDDLNKAMSGMTDEQRKAAEATIFTSYGMKAFDKMCVSSTEKVHEFEEGLRSATGSAAAQASEQLNNLKGDMTIFGSAMEGLGVTIFNEMSGSFRGIVQSATEMVTGINESLQHGKIGAFVENAKKYLYVLIAYGKRVGTAFGSAFSAVGQALAKLNGSFGSAKNVLSFRDVCDTVADALIALAGFIEQHASTIAKIISILPKVVGAFLAFKAISFVGGIVTGIGGAFMKLGTAIAGGIGNSLASTASGMTQAGSAALQTSGPMLAAAKSFMMIGAGLALTATAFALLAQSAIALAGAGGPAIAVMAGLVVAVAALSIGMMALVTHAAATSAQMTAAGSAFLMIGAAVLLVAAGFAIMAAAAIALTNAGTPAIAMFVGMVAAMALLAVGAAALAPALTAGAVGLIAFGAAVVLVATGALIAAAAIAVVSAVLPTIAEYGTTAAVAFVALGAALVIFGAGALAGGAGALVLAAGLVAVGAGVLVAAVGVAALGAAVLILGAGALTCAAAMLLMSAALPTIAASGTQAAVSLAALGAAMVVFAAGSVAAGAGAAVLAAGLTAAGAGALVAAAGVTALGAAVLVLGAGVLVCAAGVLAMGAALALIGANATTVTAGFTALAGGVTALGAGIIALTASLVAFTAGLVAMTAGLVAGTAAFVAFAASVTAASVGMAALAVAAAAVQASVSSISSNASSAASSLKQMQTSLSIVQNGMNALQSAVNTVMSAVTSAVSTGSANVVSVTQSGVNRVNSAITQGKSKAVSTVTAAVTAIVAQMTRGAAQAAAAGVLTGTGYAAGIASASGAVSGAASGLVSAAVGTMSGGYGSAYAAGSYIGQGLANGLASQAGSVAAQAAALAAAANAAIAAKAQIGSPSKITTQYGKWYGQGFVNGISDMASKTRRASEKLVSFPTKTLGRQRLNFGAVNSELGADYTYDSAINVTVVSELDGREIARGTYRYIDGEIQKSERRESRKRGQSA